MHNDDVGLARSNQGKMNRSARPMRIIPDNSRLDALISGTVLCLKNMAAAIITNTKPSIETANRAWDEPLDNASNVGSVMQIDWYVSGTSPNGHLEHVLFTFTISRDSHGMHFQQHAILWSPFLWR
jgi:hypothetical protein